MNKPSVSSSRRYDFDWLRVLLILTVFVFHSMHFFDPGWWHVKDANANSMLADIAMAFISRWMMPMIFIVSGVACYYALGKRSGGQFLKERVQRLLVPLVVGLFTHVTLQSYLQARSISPVQRVLF